MAEEPTTTTATATTTRSMPRPTPAGVAAWVAFLVVGGLFVGSLAVARARHERVIEAWRTETAPKRKAGAAFWQKVRGMHLQSWDEVERGLGMKLADGPKVHENNPNHRVGVVTDPASGFTFDLAFYNDELRKSEPRPLGSPPMTGWPRALDGVRLWLARVGWFVWLVLLAQILMTGRRRRVLSQVLLGLSLLLFACVLLEGYPSSPWYGFLVRWWSALAVLMPVLSVLTLVSVYRTREWQGGLTAVAAIPTPPAAAADDSFAVEDDEERGEEPEATADAAGEKAAGEGHPIDVRGVPEQQGGDVAPERGER